MTDRYGTYETRGDRPTLRFERRLSHPVDVVWRAITESGELEHWFPSRVVVDQLRPGAELRFEFEHMPIDAPTTMTGRVTDFEPPHLFAFFWGEDHLRFELEPLPADADACLLRLTVLLDSRDKAARDSAGWHVCLDRLEARLDGSGALGQDGDWTGLYEDYQRRGMPAGAPVPID
jgi:uncharacterized protein YndB with AHSA1/START domain